MIESPFNYTGSKFKLLNQLVPEFDLSKPYFIDLFCGGGSVYTNVAHLYDKVLVNDIIKDLIGIHQGLIDGDDIILKTKAVCPGKENAEAFSKLRENFNSSPEAHKLWALMLSSTNNMIRFNKSLKYNQSFGKRSWNSSTETKVINFTNHIRQYKNKIKFISKPFGDVEVKSDKIMVYCDPPYSNTEAGYNSLWNKDDDEKLYRYLLKVNDVGSSFMISGTLNHDGVTCKLLQKLIDDGFNWKELEFDYNKVSRKGKKETKEIIIKNY